MNPEDFRKVFDSVKVVPDPEEEARDKRKEERDFRAKLHICGIEKRFAECTFEKIEGNGIPKEILEKLFSPVTSSKGERHQGLWLSIVHDLINELKGVVTCRSNSSGTTFDILLPVRSAAIKSALTPKTS